jgi:hypothetical protein
VESGYRDWTATRFPVAQTADGGFIVGSGKLRKTNTLGQEIWARTYNHLDVVFDVLQTPDGGYAATGVGSSAGARTRKELYQLALLRVNAQGTQQWLKLRSNTRHGSQGLSITLASGGGFTVGGEDGTGTLTRFNSLGAVVWSTSELNEHRWTGDCVQTSDGGYMALVGNRLIRFGADGD